MQAHKGQPQHRLCTSPGTKSHLSVCKEKVFLWRSPALIRKPSAVLLSCIHGAMLRRRKSAARQRLSANPLDLQEMSWQVSELGEDWLGCKGKSIGTIIFPLKMLASSEKRNLLCEDAPRPTTHSPLASSIPCWVSGEQNNKVLGCVKMKLPNKFKTIK